MHAEESADRATRNELAPSLKFFDDVARLVHEIGRTMCVALDQGHAAVCVVTPATRDLLEQQLRARGIDVDDMRRSGQYVHIDAAEALDTIAPEGEGPDGGRFDATVGVVVDRLANTYHGVWMYGELAGLMWMGGNQVGAVQLDKMWTSFADTHPVCLCVAFPLEALSYPLVAEAIHQVVADQIRILAKDSPLALAVRHGPSGAD
jgi:hypothetical protein